jgi:hypothetical protein
LKALRVGVALVDATTTSVPRSETTVVNSACVLEKTTPINPN